MRNIGMVVGMTGLFGLAAFELNKGVDLGWEDTVNRCAEIFGPMWANITHNPLPFVLAVGTFVLTVAYHKVRGKSLRDALEAAAIRNAVTYVPPPLIVTDKEEESPIVERARNRQTLVQLMDDRKLVMRRRDELPMEIRKAEEEFAYAELALEEAERTATVKKNEFTVLESKLKRLRKEHDSVDSELAQIDVELTVLESKV